MPMWGGMAQLKLVASLSSGRKDDPSIVIFNKNKFYRNFYASADAFRYNLRRPQDVVLNTQIKNNIWAPTSAKQGSIRLVDKVYIIKFT